MSRIHTFRGDIDAPYEGEPNVVHAVVFGTDDHTPAFGFVTIPVKCIKSPYGELRDGDRIVGRMCPRSIRVWVVGRRIPGFQRWLHELRDSGEEDVLALDAHIQKDETLLYCEGYAELHGTLAKRLGDDHDLVTTLDEVHEEFQEYRAAQRAKSEALLEALRAEAAVDREPEPVEA